VDEFNSDQSGSKIPVQYDSGYVGDAFFFTAFGSFVASSAVKIPGSNQDRTIEFWFKLAPSTSTVSDTAALFGHGFRDSIDGTWCNNNIMQFF
jgi:hypothetical protein